MPKRPTITPVNAGFTSRETINTNFANIEEKFDNTLSRDGSTPNEMEADLDMNSNDILNVGHIDAGSLLVNGEDVGGVLTAEQVEAAQAAALAAEGSAATALAAAASIGVNSFESEADLAAAVEAGSLTDGETYTVNGLRYTVDSSVAFGDSILRDYGIAGVRHDAAPHNELLGCFFHGRHKGAVTFNTSYDGVNFSTLNYDALPAKGTGNDTLGGRDPSVFYYRGNWYIMYTGSDEATHDFRMGVSPDMLSWTEHYMSLGATIKTSDTVPMAGGTYPAVNIWAPEVVFNPTDEELYVVLNVVYDGQLTDDYGGTINNRRPFYSTFDPETKTVGEPVAINMGGGEHLTSYIGHAFLTDSDGVLWMAIKDDVTKKMGIWKSTGGIAGLFTKETEILSDISQEGYSWVKNFYREENGTETFNYRIYIDQNRNGPDQPYPDTFAEIPWYIECDTPDGVWSEPKRAYTGTPVRHGTVLNMAHNVSPQAMQDVERLRALCGSDPRTSIKEEYDLGGESTDWKVTPRQDFLFYVDGVGTVSNLTIMDGSADRFYLGSRGGDAGTGINIVYETDGGDVVSNTPDTPMAIGFGGEYIVEMRRSADGIYYPTSPVSGSGSGSVPASETVSGIMKIATIADIRAGGTGPNDEAIVPAKMRGVPRYVPGTEGAVESTDKVWMLDTSLEEMRWLNIEDLPTGAGGLVNWTESATQFYPNTSGARLGSPTRLIREVALEPRKSIDGTAGTITDTALFVAQDRSVRLAPIGETDNNEGQDIGHFHRAYEPVGIQSGTHVWNPQNGQGLNFTGSLTGALTVDVSDMKVGEEIRIRIADPDNNTVSFILPSGAINWVGSAPTWGEEEILVSLWRLGSSNLIGVAVEVGT